MVEEARIQFGLIRIDETRSNLLDETKHNDLTSEKYKKTCKYLNYVENLLILVSTVTGCISISAFASLVCFYWYCKFCRRIKHLCNHCRNQKV